MQYKSLISKPALVLGLFVLFVDLSSTALAQVDIPRGSERRPNLSLDPFERAREAIKKLPTAEEQQDPKRETTTQESVQQPPPTKEAPEEAAEPEEPGQAFSYAVLAVADYFNLVNGGVSTSADPNEAISSGTPLLLDLSAEVDTAAAGLWDNGTFFGHVIVYGAQNSPGDIVGDYHGASNIDAGGESMSKLQEAWYQHSFEHGRASILVGVHDWNSEFDVSEYSNLFLNGSMGMNSVLSASAGPSNYPSTGLGLRFFSELTEESYFQVAIYDGIPDEGGFVALNIANEEGFFASMESGASAGEPGEDGYYRVGAGAWYLRSPIETYTGAEDDETFDWYQPPQAINLGSFPAQPGTYGAYAFGEMAFGDRIGAFVRAAWSDPRYNRYSQYFAGGITYSGLVPGRVDDVFGVGLVHTRQSANFLADNVDATGSNSSYTFETTYEVTYSAQINDWLMIQPDLQYVQYPAMQFHISNALFVGIRAQAEF